MKRHFASLKQKQNSLVKNVKVIYLENASYKFWKIFLELIRKCAILKRKNAKTIEEGLN